MRWFLLLSLVAACGTSDAPPPAPPAGSATPPAAPTAPSLAAGCTQLLFAESTPIPEASAAAWMMIDAKLSLVVISDSGNKGAYGIVDPETGVTGEQGALPLGDVGDDFEGAAVRQVGNATLLTTLTSSGWVREYERIDRGFKLFRPAYPLARNQRNPDEADPDVTCGRMKTNCKLDLEGLCLASHAAADSPLIGYVASKDRGTLYGVTNGDGFLAIATTSTIRITEKGRLADCAFSDDDTLYTGDNAFGLFTTRRIDGWSTPASAKVTEVGGLGGGFPEVIAARGKEIYRMSDAGGTPSLMWRYRCP